MSLVDPQPWLLVVAAAHLGFQLTVSLVVYPALREVTDEAWPVAHRRHSRRIAPLVAALYAPLLVLLVWTAAIEPQAAGTWLALLGGALSVLTTAAIAAPLHGRLGSAPGPQRPELLATLARADLVRTLGAGVCLAGAVLLAT